MPATISTGRSARLTTLVGYLLAELGACRHAELGGHVWRCDRCGAVQAAYNSCRNRHCPTCQGFAKARWLEARRAEFLPVPYFQVVTTLPGQLHILSLANRAVVYDLLLRCTAHSVLELAADPEYLGAEMGLYTALQT